VRAIVAALALLTRGVLGHAAGRVATEEGPPRRYVGAAACSSNNCHGSVTPRLDSKRSMQNEYVTWYKSDRHAKAYEALVGERALRIARLLGMVDASAAAATWLKQTPRAERCLDCHTLNVPAGLRASKFNLEDGVSCEACHGPANAWLTKHTERGWDPAQSLGLGMLDTTDPGRAAETCLTCHLGTATKRVDHEMLAAGHPPVAFELDTFAANMPPHWKEHDANRRWFRGGAWTAGQAVALREAVRHLVQPASEHGWPDFSVYECSSCHHDLRKPSWRQQRGYAGRTPGAPSLDPSRHTLLLFLARAVGSPEAAALSAGMQQIGRLASDARPPRDVDAVAGGVVAAAGRVLERTAAAPLDDGQMRRLLRDIVDAAEPLAYDGFRTAQQAAWALDALAVARVEVGQGGQPGKEGDPLRRAIGQLFEDLRDPAAYDPARFARDVGTLRRYVP